MRIISLDQSTSATGVAIFDNGKLINYELIEPKKTKNKKITDVIIEQEEHLFQIIMPEDIYDLTLNRTALITDRIEALFKEYKPNVVFFEEVFENPVTKNRNPKGYRSLARLQGFIAHVCYKLNIPYEIKEENSWITAWGTYSSKIKREERKKDILVKVNEYYNLNLTRDDLSDAIGLGRYAVENYKK